MKVKNRIVNYFVVPPKEEGGKPYVWEAPVTMNAITGKKLLNDFLKEKKEKGENVEELPTGTNLLHICFDVDSEIMYAPNATSFHKESLEALFQAAKLRVVRDFGNFSLRPIIEGSPFSSLRVRSINSFTDAKKAIEQHYKGKLFKDLPVLEANLTRMPTTRKSLPKEYQGDGKITGGYISPSVAESISFIDEIDLDGRKRENKILLLRQKTPFILIDISRKADVDATEKEWMVLAAYRDYLYDKKVSQEEEYITEDINKFADLYAIKRLLYLGWSFEEVTSYLTREIKNPEELMNSIRLFMKAVDSLVEDGYPNPASMPFYITYKIDPDDIYFFQYLQFEHFKVLDFDKATNYILIETPVFLSPIVCEEVLQAKSKPFVGKYNPVMNKIDVKGSSSIYNEVSRNAGRQLKKIEFLVKEDVGLKEKDEKIEFRLGPGADGAWASNPMVYNIRKISDYYYASDFIKRICEENDVPFTDLDVVIGPIERFMGRGAQGGFTAKESFLENNIKIPHEIDKGVFITPPVILINSITTPSYATQTKTLIHEYTHNIYHITHPKYKKQYGDISGKKGEAHYKEWYKYLTDPNEVAAHKQEIKYELMLGESVDEIIRDKVGGEITLENYGIALKFRELVEEASEEISREKEIDETPETTEIAQ